MARRAWRLARVDRHDLDRAEATRGRGLPLTFYVDTSALVPLFIDEASSGRLKEFFTAVEDEVAVSTFSIGEFGSTISRLVRMDRTDRAAARKLLNRFDDWRSAKVANVEVLPVDIRKAGLLVREPFPKLLLPDAIHLAACKRTEMTLVTLDELLAEVARAHDVTVIVP